MNNELRIMQKRVIIFLLIALFIQHFAAPSAHAQQGVELGVYPPIIQVDANAPAEVESPMSVINLSDTPVSITIKLRPFTQSSQETGVVQLLPDNAPLPGEDPQFLRKVAVLDGDTIVTELSLAPKQQKDLKLHMSIPKNEPPSDYYFSVLYQSKYIGNDQSTVASLVGGISTNVLVSIGPKGPTTGSIDTFQGPIFVQEGPVRFSVKVANTSSHFITPQGGIVISDIFGKPIGKVDLLPVNILEHSSRFVPSDVTIDETALLENNVYAIWPEKFLLGIYSAKLTLALSDTGPLYHRTIYFFAFPILGLFGIFLAVCITTMIVLRVRKRVRS